MLEVLLRKQAHVLLAGSKQVDSQDEDPFFAVPLVFYFSLNFSAAGNLIQNLLAL